MTRLANDIVSTVFVRIVNFLTYPPPSLSSGSRLLSADGIILISNIAADEFAAELMSGMHNNETASRRVDDEIAQRRDCLDQCADQPDGLGMWMQLAIDLLRPAIRNRRARRQVALATIGFFWWATK